MQDYTRLYQFIFSNAYKNNDKTICIYFKDKYVKSRVRLKKIDEKTNYFIEDIKLNDLMSGKYNKACKYLNHVEHLVILVSTTTGCV